MLIRHCHVVIAAVCGIPGACEAPAKSGSWARSFAPTPFRRALVSADLQIGLMLPCHAVVYERESGRSWVEFLNSLVALGVMGNQQLTPVVREAKERLERVAQSLTE